MFYVDGLEGFAEGGLSGRNPNHTALGAAVQTHIEHASNSAKQHPNFVEGLSVLVACGFGRAISASISAGFPEPWRLESMGAHDLITLSWLRGFDGLSLWRVSDSQRAIERQGTALLNVNGFVNLVAISRQLDGHLVPHGAMGDEFAERSPHLIVMQQNAIRSLRHAVLSDWDPRRVLDQHGRWVAVRKMGQSAFPGDAIAPLYGSEEDVINRRLRAVYLAKTRPWWVEIKASDNDPSDSVFQHWEMLCMWLNRAAPVLDGAYVTLTSGPIEFLVEFERVVGHTPPGVAPKGIAELRSLIQVSAEHGGTTIRVRILRGFEDGFMQPENTAERVIVEALVAGAATAAGEAEDVGKQQSGLVSAICPNTEARHIHRFETNLYRDFIRDRLPSKVLLIDPIDVAANRIGLGWRIRPRESGPEIVGVIECTSYLNQLVELLLEEMCVELRSLNRGEFIHAALIDHEAAACDREHWHRTTQAMLALREDRAAARSVIVDHEAKLNACSLACRTLIEAAVCECPVEGGRATGKLDLSRLMAKLMLVFYLGGWSDAVRSGAMEPRIKITPLGDVHMNHNFLDTVYEPFARTGGDERVEHASDSYAENYDPVQVIPEIAFHFSDKFVSAWRAEFGFSLDQFRSFLDALEQAGGRMPKR